MNKILNSNRTKYPEKNVFRWRLSFWLFGFAISTFTCLVFMNFTTTAPEYIYNDEGFGLMPLDVIHITEYTPPKAENPKPMVYKSPIQIFEVIPTEEPLPKIDAEVKTQETQAPILNIPMNTNISKESGEKHTIPEKPVKPVLRAQVMPYLSSCGNIADEAERKICSETSLMNFIRDELEYPRAAVNIGIIGTVMMRFVVDVDGKVKDIKILRDLGGGCGEEAKRVLGLLNDKEMTWIPGNQNGRAVPVLYTLPVKFTLKN